MQKSSVLVENMLKKGEKCNTYLSHVYRYLLSIEDQNENIKTGSFQPTLWLSSAVQLLLHNFSRYRYGGRDMGMMGEAE
jgi:hypothetical protein